MNGKSLILDANLLVLFVVGMTNHRPIGKHKRLKAYSIDDFDLLCRLIAGSPKLLVTPNTLTETSNLIGYIDEPVRTQIFATLGKIIPSTQEEYVESRSAVQFKEFLRLGLTDSVLLQITGESCSLLTTDLNLYLAAAKRGASVINFNHLRGSPSQNL